MTSPDTYEDSKVCCHDHEVLSTHLACPVGRKIAVGVKSKCTFVASRMIFNHTIAMIVDPQLADNNVVNGGCNFFERVVMIRIFEFDVRVSSCNMNVVRIDRF